MRTAFTIAGLASAAFAVWLVVRIVNRRERWAKRTAVALSIILVLYPLSVGPAVWLTKCIGGEDLMEAVTDTAFFPLFLVANNGPLWIARPIQAYLIWWDEVPVPPWGAE
jgi:hypothetical protein